MIKIICDKCGFEREGYEKEIVQKQFFEFTTNLTDGTKTIQICPMCQLKLKDALQENLDNFYNSKGAQRRND